MVQLAKDPPPPHPPILHKKSNGPSLIYFLHYSKMGFVPDEINFIPRLHAR